MRWLVPLFLLHELNISAIAQINIKIILFFITLCFYNSPTKVLQIFELAKWKGKNMLQNIKLGYAKIFFSSLVIDKEISVYKIEKCHTFCYLCGRF